MEPNNFDEKKAPTANRRVPFNFELKFGKLCG